MPSIAPSTPRSGPAAIRSKAPTSTTEALYSNVGGTVAPHRMVGEPGEPITAFLAPWLTIPARFDAWIGLLVIAVEMIGLLFGVGWAISYLGNVPYCRRDRRFYDLREIVETRDEDLLPQWRT